VKYGSGLGGYRELEVWKKTNELAKEIYRISGSLPQNEIYALTSQIRRAALSVPTNIVEGNARSSKAERRHFVDIARGSLAETEFLLEFAKDQGYIREETAKVENLIYQSSKLLWAFRKSLY
jgi:four helix bundle protein